MIRTGRRNFKQARRAALFALLAMLLLGGITSGGRPARAQSPVPQDERDPHRFASVEKWVGTFSWQGSGAGSEQVMFGALQWNGSHSASGTFMLEGPTFPYGGNIGIWEGPAVGTGSINDEIILTNDCEQYYTWKGNGAMPGTLGSRDGQEPSPLSAELRVDFETGKYWVSVGPEYLDAEAYTRYTCDDDVDEMTDSYTTALGAGGFSSGRATGDLPETGLNIDGTVSFDDQLPQMWALGLPGQGGIVKWTHQWGLQPAGKNDVEMVVSPEGFDAWLPEGGTAVNRGGVGVGASAPAPAGGVDVEFTGGNTLTVTARLQAADGGALKQTARKFTFELLDVSNEPGIAMNAPNVKASEELPDLEFDQIRNLPVSVEVVNARKAETTTEGITEAQAILSANDYGAWGTLKVTAELESGQTIVGYLEGDKEQKEIRIPKRKPDSKVADYWKQQFGAAGKADNDDAENAPEGWEYGWGDGLTLYEEYRGFFENGKHIRTTPVRKDFFVVDQINTIHSRAGIAMFKQATQLETHGEMLLSETAENMVVNFNHGQGPHLVDQHGTLLQTAHGTGYGGVAIKRPGLKGTGTPGTYAGILIDFAEDPRANKKPGQAERYASIVAHELAHTVAVAEHGAGDRGVSWMAWEDDDGVLRLHESDMKPGSTIETITITVKYEDGTVIPPNSPIFGGDMGLPLILGVKNGQHSGVQDCLMRYDISSAYISNSDPHVRYFVKDDEPRGTMLCRIPYGTGVNAPNHRPQSRYGRAGSNRGDDVHQICVNDAAMPPNR